jgi:hypothetical protein
VTAGPAEPAKLHERSPRGDVHPEHVAEHAVPTCTPTPVRNSDQRGAREKIGKKAELEYAGEHEKTGGRNATMPTSTM